MTQGSKSGASGEHLSFLLALSHFELKHLPNISASVIDDCAPYPASSFLELVTPQSKASNRRWPSQYLVLFIFGVYIPLLLSFTWSTFYAVNYRESWDGEIKCAWLWVEHSHTKSTNTIPSDDCAIVWLFLPAASYGVNTDQIS